MKRFLILLFILFQVVNTYGQEIKVHTPKVVAVGEQFMIKFTITGEPTGNFTPPAMENIRIQAGPALNYLGENDNGNIIEHYTYSYYVDALKEGKANIGKAEAIVGGKTVSSTPVVIDVVKADAKPKQQQGGQQQTQPNTNISSDDLFARVELSRSSLYRGESLVASVKIYTRVGITGYSSPKVPSFTGFFSQEMEVPESERGFHRQNVNGVIYNVATIWRYVLSPQQLGTLVISPFEITFSVQVAKPRQSRSFFDDFMDSPYTEVQKKVVSPSVSVNVKDLPAGAPASFKGAVGNFKIESNIDKTHTQANQALVYSFTISGTGNLKLVEIPKINFPIDFDKYDPKIVENIKTTAAGNVGNKKHEYALIPRSAGDFTIPPVEFSYFDPSKGSYVTIKSSEVNIKVDKDPNGGGAATTTVPGINQQNIRHIGQDIVFIKTTPLAAKVKGNFFFASLPYHVILLALFVVFLIIYFILKKRIKDSGNVVLMRNRTANKVALKRLKTSNQLLKEGNIHGFYDELLRAMWGYASHKLNIPVSNLSRENAQDTLQARNVQQADIDTFLNVIDECEFARYAPGTGRSQMEHVYNNAISVISKFEQTIR